MEIEEGVNVTEQVVALLDQMIKQGKQLRILDTSEMENPLEQCTDDEFIGYGKIELIAFVYHRHIHVKSTLVLIREYT